MWCKVSSSVELLRAQLPTNKLPGNLSRNLNWDIMQQKVLSTRLEEQLRLYLKVDTSQQHCSDELCLPMHTLNCHKCVRGL